jgi:hypothetical protein
MDIGIYRLPHFRRIISKNQYEKLKCPYSLHQGMKSNRPDSNQVNFETALTRAIYITKTDHHNPGVDI